jgi:hypothetical protein
MFGTIFVLHDYAMISIKNREADGLLETCGRVGHFNLCAIK